MLVRIAIAALVSAGLFAAPAAAQGIPAPTVTLRHEIVQGTVTAVPVAATPDAVAKPLAGVDVIVTRGPDRAYKSSKTDAAGHYVIDWPDGTGDNPLFVDQRYGPNNDAGARFRGRSWGLSGHDLLRRICPLLTQSGHAYA